MDQPDAQESIGDQGGRRVVVCSGLDDLRSAHLRFLQEAAQVGRIHLRLASDALIASRTGRAPVFPEAERRFIARSLRDVDTTQVVDHLPVRDAGSESDLFLLSARPEDRDILDACRASGLRTEIVDPASLRGFPQRPEVATSGHDPRKRAVVTGCFDWLHSGHIRFFLDAAAVGELHVVVGSDANVRLLKGPQHPLHHEVERRYVVDSVRSVHRAYISTGTGWLDAEPEIAAIEPDFYVVNDDGDHPDKRAFCRAHGIEYVVLDRKPHPGLPARTSTGLRGY